MPDFPTIPYNPADWYWYIGGDETRPYSSAAGRPVQSGNAAFKAWLAGGGVPTRIASADELADVLAAANVRPTDTDMLDRYKGAHAGRMTLEIAAKLFFAMENELRALRGEEPYTPAQFRAYVKERM